MNNKEEELGTYVCNSCDEEHPNRKKGDIPGGCTECNNMYSFTFVADKIIKKTQNDIHKTIPETIAKPKNKSLLKEKETEEEKFKSLSVVKFLCQGDYEKFKKRVEKAIELSEKGGAIIGTPAFLQLVFNEVRVRKEDFAYNKEVVRIAKYIIKNRTKKKEPSKHKKKTSIHRQLYLPGFD